MQIKARFTYQLIKKPAINIIVLLVAAQSGFTQTVYSLKDQRAILAARKEIAKAENNWDPKIFYQSGDFFEKIYDKYKDSSMNAAIYCYRQAALSESEYGDRKESYNAALKLAHIYEKGKGTSIQLHRALIYYYLKDKSDTYPTYTIKLSDPKDNKDFQRLKNYYCNLDSVSIDSIGNNENSDLFRILISPFCNITGKKTMTAIAQAAEFMRKNPEKTIKIKISGDGSVQAAQYSLILLNYTLPGMYRRLVNYFVEKEGISADRFMPLEIDLDNEQSEYQLTINF